VEVLLPGLLYGAFIDGHVHRIVRPWRPDEALTLGSVAEPDGVSVYPSNWIDNLAHDRWPDQIIFYSGDFDDEPATGWTSAGEGALNIIERMSVSAFVNFFETSKYSFRDRFGARRDDWPPQFRFAFHVRNAMVHGGMVSIAKGESGSTWRDINLDKSKNGAVLIRQIINIGDLPLLMADISFGLGADVSKDAATTTCHSADSGPKA
jgi:hypothetical protein